MMTFDEDFILDRLFECLGICEFQVKRSFENELLFHRSYQQAQRWLNRYELLLGADSHKVIYIKSKLAILRASFVEHEILLDLESEELETVQEHNAKNKQVLKPAASAQLPVCRVLGQVSKAATERQQRPLSLGWFPITAQLLSNTRSVGGLA